MELSYKSIATALLILAGTTASLKAQDIQIDDKYVENDVVSLAGKKGFSFSTKAGDFLFKPYALVQASGTFNYYDGPGLETPYADNIANSGFAIPNAILGFTGKAFGKVTFNLSINAAKSGGALLQQAWFDVALKESFRIRVGKFKTPFSHGYLTTLGETLFPVLPTSLNTAVSLPYSLNSVNPVFATGFDLGIQFHGLVNGKWNYQVGIFNGTGINVNTATKTMSDDHKWLPSLLYSGRIAYMPKGVMPSTQGDPENLNDDKISIALATSYNVEAENESSNDLRLGVEFSWIKNRFYFAAEGYYLNMKFTKRQMISKAYNFWGAYAQAGYFITDKLQGALRYDLFDRNGADMGGLLNMPAIGANYYFFNSNLKLQVMYQFMGRTGHASQIDRDDDGVGMPMHSATAMLQYTF
ncbi:porin [Parabacteroides faecis]|uniref:porin n=1 Tax=Parabacteroides TaxID=375288 RepID=UPI000EFDE4A3|nr:MULTISPECIES: porin [Parabacteroides]MBC8620612.1 porin [Parabacteroides faecis]RHR93600.1 porin [Parabacteroides sp. AF14-59]